jgi:hypothetical protein
MHSRHRIGKPPAHAELGGVNADRQLDQELQICNGC